MSERLRVLELFCGIGGCSAALNGRAEVVAAIDIHRRALAVYQHNFSHPTLTRTIESLQTRDFAEWAADLWWLSPPCQPYTRRGRQRDLDDPRSLSLRNVLDRACEMRPPYLALENVPGFAGSRAHQLVRTRLENGGYQVREILLCPTELGIPNRRRRFYLVASREALLPWPTPAADTSLIPIAHFLQPQAEQELVVPCDIVQKYRGATHALHPADPLAVSHCFTSAYGRSVTASGSYLLWEGGWRRFSPEEQLKLLGFPDSYTLPRYRHPREMWPLTGNSLSVHATRLVLSAIAPLAGGVWERAEGTERTGGIKAGNALGGAGCGR